MLDKTQDSMVRDLLRQRLESEAKALRMDETRNAIRSIHKQVAGLDMGGPLLPPAAVPPVTSPRVHHVVAWRHDGEVRKTVHASKEVALEFARALSWAIVWQWAIMDGRDMLERALVNPPADMDRADVALVIGG